MYSKLSEMPWMLIFGILTTRLYATAADATNGTPEGKTSSTTSTSPEFELITPDGRYEVFLLQPPAVLRATLFVRNGSFNAHELDVMIESSNLEVAEVVSEDITIGNLLAAPENETVVYDNSDPCGHDELGNSSTLINDDTMECRRLNITFRVFGKRLGYSTLTFTLFDATLQERNYSGSVLTHQNRVVVRRPTHVLDKVFQVLLAILTTFAALLTGTDIEWALLKKYVRRPKSPIVTFVSQFTLMPLIAFSVIHILNLEGGSAMGIYLLGTGPGGGISNLQTKLANGDMSLSVTMTAISTLASLGMMPFWVYTLGRLVPSETEIKVHNIPYTDILQSLALLAVPAALGFLIKLKLPRVAKIMRKCIKAYIVVVLVVVITFLIYLNYNTILTLTPQFIFGCQILPFGGLVLGGFFAWVTRHPWKLIKTIAIEVAMQNTTITLLILKTSFVSPESDLGTIPPTMVLVVGASILNLALMIYVIYDKCMRRKKQYADSGEGEDDVEINEGGNDSKQISALNEGFELQDSEKADGSDAISYNEKSNGIPSKSNP